MMSHKEENKKIATIIMLWTYIFGIFTHGEMIFYKISMHDDIGLFYSSYGIYSGRWAGAIYDKIVRIVFGNKFSSPVFSSFISFLFLALCSWIVVDLLEIKETLNIVAICALSVVCPSVTHTLMYMICAPLFFLALFLCAFSAWITVKYRFGWLISVVCISISLGMYQAYLGYFITLLLLWGIKELLRGNRKRFWGKAVVGFLAASGGVLSYLIVLKFFEFKTGSYATYNGMDHMTSFDLKSRLIGLKECYITYMHILCNRFSLISTTQFMCWAYRLFLLVLIVLFVMLVKRSEVSVKNKFLATVCFLLIPIGTNIIFLLKSEGTIITALVLYPMILATISGVVICEWNANNDKSESKSRMINKMLKAIMLCLVGLICLNYSYISNATYMKLSFLQEKTISYQTTLVARIKSTDGYKDEYPVLWVGDGRIADKTVNEKQEWGTLDLGYAADSTLDVINNYEWQTFMLEHVGYCPDTVSIEEVSDTIKSQIGDMPCYPDEGAIQMIDGVVIVKLGEE